MHQTILSAFFIGWGIAFFQLKALPALYFRPKMALKSRDPVLHKNEKIEDDKINDNEYDTTRKRISLSRVLECFRDMGHTEEELEMERVMMYADPMYRRGWTDGQWIMVSGSLSGSITVD